MKCSRRRQSSLFVFLTIHPRIVALCVISGFRRELDGNCAILGHYAASSGNVLPTFRENPEDGADVVPKRR